MESRCSNRTVATEIQALSVYSLIIAMPSSDLLCICKISRPTANKLHPMYVGSQLVGKCTDKMTWPTRMNEEKETKNE